MLNLQKVVATRVQQQAEQPKPDRVGNVIEYFNELSKALGVKVTSNLDIRVKPVSEGGTGRPFITLCSKGVPFENLFFSTSLKKQHDLKPFDGLDLLTMPIYSGAKTDEKTGKEYVWATIGVEGAAPENQRDIDALIKERDAMRAEMAAAAAKLGKAN